MEKIENRSRVSVSRDTMVSFPDHRVAIIQGHGHNSEASLITLAPQEAMALATAILERLSPQLTESYR